MNQYKCIECNIEYKTNCGLWKHNKNKHTVLKKIENNNCKYCNKELGNRHSRWRHENKTCKKIPTDIIKLEDDTTTNKMYKNIPTNIKVKDIIIKPINTHNYIYLIENYDMNINQVLYRVGKSNRPIHMRLKEHGSEAKILLIVDVDNCDTTECNLLTILNNDINIIKRKDIGNEYFSCNNIDTPRSYIKNLVIKNL